MGEVFSLGCCPHKSLQLERARNLLGREILDRELESRKIRHQSNSSVEKLISSIESSRSRNSSLMEEIAHRTKSTPTHYRRKTVQATLFSGVVQSSMQENTEISGQIERLQKQVMMIFVIKGLQRARRRSLRSGFDGWVGLN